MRESQYKFFTIHRNANNYGQVHTVCNIPEDLESLETLLRQQQISRKVNCFVLVQVFP